MAQASLPGTNAGVQLADTALTRKMVSLRRDFPGYRNYLIFWGFLGGRSRTRTYDPLIKSQLLYHLSYAP